MLYALIFIAGSVVGLFLGLTLSQHGKAFRELQNKLATKEAEYTQYQDQVADHFQRTAELFAEIQVRQDKLASHLQEGSKRLRGNMVPNEEAIIALTSYDPTIPRDYIEGT